MKVVLSRDEYFECLGFAMYSYLSGKIVKRDLIKGSARSLGEYLEHLIRGKLAEVAFKKALNENFGLEVLVETDLPVFLEGKYLPDVVSFKREDTWHVPEFWIDVKATVEGQAWMLIPANKKKNGYHVLPRPYDAYVDVDVKLPADHLGRLIKYAPVLKDRVHKSWLKKLEDIERIEAEVRGFILYKDLRDIQNAKDEEDEGAQRRLSEQFGEHRWNIFEEGEKLYDPSTGATMGKGLGRCNFGVFLENLRKEWDDLRDLLEKNVATVPERFLEIRKRSQFRTQAKRAIQKLLRNGRMDWFERAVPITEATQTQDLSKYFI